ncbi:helix-turn-helix domain-containing protein [Jatrophihabitans telluris]|uniref:Helix-turn-helix domain-containing protein n=1 Tax=Jatrophihabitans telluris TaxID=2038343 RepID=A0ABY4R703_9ACTN|nr:helix-turn-helix domain-containing protein [Jatrophihabitans telluris]UQX90249.1 helix-turn-helix domain-containing protein [Jatrophihabitans telluris]
MSAEVLAEVAAGGAADAGGVAVELLADFLPALVDAVTSGKPLSRRQMTAYQAIGGHAARQGVALRALLDLYLSAGWRLWRRLPAVVDAARDPDAVVVAGEVMLHAVDDAVAALTEGYQLARRTLVRVEESARREFIDDLLTGGTDVAGLLERATGYGLDLTGPHAVALVAAERVLSDGLSLIGIVERAVLGRKGDADTLVATKDGQLVVVFPAPDDAAVEQVVTAVCARLGPRAPRGGARGSRLGAWQLSVGRSGIGPHGVLTSYQEAREALTLTARLGITEAVVRARELLVYRVLLRDREAITDLVVSVLSPLRAARGGASPLLDTVIAYFGTGSNTAATARSLQLSVRAVSYRLERVQSLTGLNLSRPADQFALNVAVLGAKLLGWPEDEMGTSLP